MEERLQFCNRKPNLKGTQVSPTSPLPDHGRSNTVNVAGPDLIFLALPVTQHAPTARQVLVAMDLAPHKDFVVLQWLPGGDIEEIRIDGPVDMTDATTPRLIVAKADRTFRLVLDDHGIEWPRGEISEGALRTLGAVSADHDIFLARDGESDRLLRPGETVNLRAEGVETLYAKSRKWKLNIQGVVIESNEPEIRVRTAMIKAGFDVEAHWIIVLKSASGRRQVDLSFVIDLREPGIEKLRLTPREINNGEAAAGFRRDFQLMPTDHAWLNDHGYDWGTIVEAGRRWLILRDVPIPPGFNFQIVTVALEIPTAYPMAEIDMFYCMPHLARADGLPIPQTQVQQPIEGRSFQRWSRHRGPVAPWRPGKDSVVTHLLLVEESFSREVEK